LASQYPEDFQSMQPEFPDEEILALFATSEEDDDDT